MTESERLSEAEATVALDRDDESGTRLVMPDEARLMKGQVHLQRYGTPRELADAAAEKAYPMGFDDGAKSRDGEVAELKVVQDWASDPEDGMLARAKELDAALEQVRALVGAGNTMSKALKAYEMDVDEAPPFVHKQMLEVWEVAKR